MCVNDNTIKEQTFIVYVLPNARLTKHRISGWQLNSIQQEKSTEYFVDFMFNGTGFNSLWFYANCCAGKNQATTEIQSTQIF